MIRQPFQQLQMELWNRKKRNSGSSIVIVIIAMAMIGILATTLLWMSYINYKIKVNDIRNKNSFYSAETVMEQILAGLQKESSDAVAIAYKETLSRWDQDDDGIQSEANHYSSFASMYLDTLVKQLKNKEKGDGYYNRDTLRNYVDSEIWKNVNESAWNNGTDETDASKAKAPVMELVNGNSLILRNVFVSYMDGDRLSIVSTDLCLDVPQIVFTKSSSSIDDLYDYLLIGNQGISLTEGSGQVTGDGSIYAGIDETTGKGGITINPASSLAINNGRHVISKGEIDVVGPGAGFIVRDAKETGSSVYAKSLDLQSGMVSLDSKTYIANDLTLSGNGSKATLTKEYYGYGTSMATGLEGTPTDQENSSAIIINGQNSTVNMSGVNTLMLAGRAYIGTNTTKKELDQNTEKNEKAVLMGESITVKGGQIAYLVPTECLGVYNGETLIGQNPLTQDQATKMQGYKDQYGEEFREVDFTRPVSRLGGETLASFGVADMDHIRKVSTQYVGGGTESKSLTYYYLVMDADNAAKYYQTYYLNGSNKESIDHYFKKYATGGILLGDYTSAQNSYTILGNALVSDALSQSGVSLLASTETATSAMTPAEAAQKSADIANVYKGLTTNLSEDGASASTFQNVFESVVKKEITTKQEDGSEQKKSIQEYLVDNGGTMEFTTEDGLKGIITTENYTLSSATGGASNIRLIISLGDIMIDRNFTGLAIAKGTITIDGATHNGAASLKRNKMELYKVLNATTGEEGAAITPMAFFVNGETGLADGVQEASTDDAGNLNIDYTEIVRYMNWEKR
jgi:hypothetical protein